MLVIKVKNGNIEQALKQYKGKFIKTGNVKKLREGKEYIKPSVEKREKTMKAKRLNNWNLKNQKK